jgi:hypothetical protein
MPVGTSSDTQARSIFLLIEEKDLLWDSKTLDSCAKSPMSLSFGCRKDNLAMFEIT